MSKFEKLNSYELLKLINDKDKQITQYFRKSISLYIDVLVKLTNVDTKESEYYISDQRWIMLNNNMVFQNLEIIKSEIMLELPFNWEFENEECNKLNIYHNEYNQMFSEHISKHPNGFKVYDQNLLNLLLIYEPLVLQYEMKNL